MQYWIPYDSPEYAKYWNHIDSGRTQEERDALSKAKADYEKWLNEQDPNWFITITDIEQIKLYLRNRSEQLGEYLSHIDTPSFAAYRAMYDAKFSKDPWYLSSEQSYVNYLELQEDMRLHPERYKVHRRMECELYWE